VKVGAPVTAYTLTHCYGRTVIAVLPGRVKQQEWPAILPIPIQMKSDDEIEIVHHRHDLTRPISSSS
jgi:hypothetical protein